MVYLFSGGDYTPLTSFALFEVTTAPSGSRVPVAPVDYVFTMEGVTAEPSGSRVPITPADYEFIFIGGTYAPGGAYSFVSEVEGSSVSGNLSVTTDDAVGYFIGEVSEAPPVLSGNLAISTDDATANFIGKNIANQGDLSATTDDPIGIFTGKYNPNVTRYAVGALTAVQQQAAQTSLQVALPCERTILTPLNTASIQQRTTPLHHTNGAVIEQTQLICTGVDAVVGQAIPLSDAFNAVVEQMTLLRPDVDSVIEQGYPLSESWTAGFDVLEFVRTESAHPVQDCKDSLHTVLRRYYREDEPVSQWQLGEVFAFAPQTDIDDGRAAITVPLLPYIFADGYTPASSFTLIESDVEAGPRNAVTRSAPPFVWQGVVNLHDFAIYHAGMLLSETETRWQIAMRLGVEFRAHVQDAIQPWTGGSSMWEPGGVFPPPPPPVDPPGHVTIYIPVQDAYIMQHILSVTLLDFTPISMSSVSLSLDADSYAWQFSGTLLDKADLSKVQQTGTDEPVQLIITINGYPFKVLVERIHETPEFSKSNITLSGRGLTALLGQPYEQPASATQSSDLTVQQLAELQLPTGWTINWTAATWVVPSGAYSYISQTPIQALAGLASDIGAIVVPNPASQVINIMPRYPVLPWDFALLSPDVTIPESVAIGLVRSNVAPYQANGVYVHGSEVGGTLAWCRLDGTDGARLAPTVSNALMTDVVGCRALAERIIAGQYEQPSIQAVTLPLDGDSVPLLAVGQFVEIMVDGSGVRGIINSVSIQASLGSVRQTIQIGEETTNTWAMFKELLPRDPLLVATLSVTDGATSLMTLLDGGVVRVRGTGTIGGKYYIRGGKIDGAAPSMSQNEVIL